MGSPEQRFGTDAPSRRLYERRALGLIEKAQLRRRASRGDVAAEVALLEDYARRIELSGRGAEEEAEARRMRLDRADLETENARLLADNTRLLEQNALLKQQAEEMAEDRDRYATLLDERVRPLLRDVLRIADDINANILWKAVIKLDDEISAAHIAGGTIVKESAA